MTRAAFLASLLLAVPASGAVIECQSFEYEPVAEVFNKLARACYSMHGGDRLPDGGYARMFVLRHKGGGCGVIPRLIVRVRADGMACIWWEAERE